jgi:UDP-glucose 4-epimerase
MRTIVTGGAGFIGSHIADRLLALGHQVTVVDDLSQGRRENVPVAASFVLRDIASPDTADLVADLKPELVVHAAAQASVPRSIADPQHDARTNIIGTLTLLNGVSRSGCRCFIYVTTGGALYGDPIQLPCSESHPVRPLSPYGLSKWTAERYLDLLADACAVRTALRLANVYGPRQRSDGEGGVVSVFLDRMRSQGTVEIHGDGEQTRDFVYVGDVVDAVVAAASAPRSLTLNIGTGVGTSVNTLFEQLARVTGFRGKAVTAPARPGDVRHSRLDASAAARELGWHPATDLETGLRLTAESWGRGS